MLRKQQKRAAQGKQTAFRVNGQNVDPKRIARFVRRYGTSWDTNRDKKPETEPQSPEPRESKSTSQFDAEPGNELYQTRTTQKLITNRNTLRHDLLHPTTIRRTQRHNTYLTNPRHAIANPRDAALPTRFIR
jgi:hypothetical protein